MSDFETKTDYLLETKGLLKDRINSLGGSITSGTTFRDYLVWLDSLYEALEEKTITGLPDSLEGKCEQEGTPTPTSPQPINVVTGRQVIETRGGDNLFNKNNPYILSNIYVATANNQLLATARAKTLFIEIEGGKTYTVSKIVSARFAIATTSTYPGINTTLLEYKQNNNATRLDITTSSSAKYLCVFFLHSSDTLTEQEILNTIMIQEGNVATPVYEDFVGNAYEINLGKQLLNLPDRTATSSGISYSCTDGTITLNNTATANSFINAYTNQTALYLEAGTYTLSANNPVSAGGSSGQNVIRIMKSNGSDVISGSVCTMNTINASTTFTITEAIIGFMQVRTQSGTSYTDFVIKPQLEKGTGTSYSPYKAPIYLGKIGTYQDYIFKNTTENPLYDSNLEEGQWYIHKEIGRYVCTGNETVEMQNNNTRFGFELSDCINSSSLSNTILVLSNYYRGVIFNNRNTDLDYTCFLTTNDMHHRVFFNTKNNFVSTSAFKTWLVSNNVEVYYVLNTPTNTLIEDEELINQLNEIEIFTVISEDFYN